jgi:hypothetical protein
MRYVALLEDLSERLTEDENDLTYLYNSASWGSIIGLLET